MHQMPAALNSLLSVLTFKIIRVELLIMNIIAMQKWKFLFPELIIQIL